MASDASVAGNLFATCTVIFRAWKSAGTCSAVLNEVVFGVFYMRCKHHVTYIVPVRYSHGPKQVFLFGPLTALLIRVLSCQRKLVSPHRFFFPSTLTTKSCNLQARSKQPLPKQARETRKCKGKQWLHLLRLVTVT